LAARAARAGAGLDEIVDMVQQNIPRVDFRAAFDTLEYLERGGRIGKAQALLGSLLKINPVIGLKDGVVFPFGKERSRARAIEHLAEFALGHQRIEEMAVEYGAAEEDAETLVNMLSARFPRERIYRARTGPVISTHTGPSLIAVTVLGDK
jgi:DegV family protein with EDD domain